ncbi:MAG: glycosyltransferase, partial [Acidimicrobiales bacterium]
MTDRPRFLLAGGGTAGHTVPAIAVGRALVAAGVPPAAIRFVGARRGSEGRLVPAAGFAITLLPGRGIERRLTPANVGALLGLGVALVQALLLVGRSRPRAVLSVGGYAGVPVALAAAALRRPLVVAEANAVPGAANRLAARFARAAAVSFAGTPLPRAVLTGNPVRAEVLAIDRTPAGRAAARAALGLPPDRVVIGVSGGSLGARRLNAAVRDLAERWAGRTDVAVHHAVGRRDW